jgi:hypothetical protein
MNTTLNTRLRLNYPSWSRPRTHWSATNPTNQQTTFRAKTHQWKLARLAACAAPVRPVDGACQAGGCSSHTTNVPESHNDFSRPWNQNTPKNTTCKEEEPFTNPSKTPPKQPRIDQQQHDPKTHGTSNSPEANPTEGTHQSDRSLALVRPVTPGQLGMNSTRGSTPPNPTPDFPIRSTVSNKTLGILGTPHGHSISKLWSTKTR